MPYAILRFQKKKSGGVSACYSHNERKKEAYKSNPDIDTSRKPENYHFVMPKQTYLREVKHMIAAAGCKTRKDSTVMVETLITASPEFMTALPPSQQREYFTRAFDFMSSKIGKDNIIAAVIHMDEKTPHMHLSFCPITPDKRLSAKDILGNQAQLSRWQTEYHNTMSERWPELQRGLSSMETRRKHIPKTKPADSAAPNMAVLFHPLPAVTIKQHLLAFRPTIRNLADCPELLAAGTSGFPEDSCRWLLNRQLNRAAA